MNTDSMHIDEDEIDIKEVFRTVYRYRYMILLFVILFATISSYYAYFQPNVYKASATVEVGLDQHGYGFWNHECRYRDGDHPIKISY